LEGKIPNVEVEVREKYSLMCPSLKGIWGRDEFVDVNKMKDERIIIWSRTGDVEKFSMSL
jgi:hypothetical protein